MHWATATLRASLDEAAQTFAFRLDFRNLAANPTVVHIHFGPSKVDGGVMAFLCGAGRKPAGPAATSGTITGTITAADVVGLAAQRIAPGDVSPTLSSFRSSVRLTAPRSLATSP
jgi:hypothetical protein